MVMSLPRLLYLGYAFPPGVAVLHPGANPAGHALETRMIAALRGHFEIRSVGILHVPLPPQPWAGDPANGINHELLLTEPAPELVSRRVALSRLKRCYLEWRAQGWMPATILVYNLGPVYNTFVRWLHRQNPRPRLVLLLLDSQQLGRRLSWSKRFRYRFKPLVVPDAEMLRWFDACIGLSTETAAYFAPTGTPFLWMPGACDPGRMPPEMDRPVEAAPVCFGYFGALSAYSGVRELAEEFLRSSISATLRICGYGKMNESLQQLAHQDARLQFAGLLKAEACLPFGQSCDVLVNPRPPGFGNQNNFPSKLFDYALCGRAILSSRISGVDHVLGDEAFYYDVARHPASLREALERIARLEPRELRRRGAAIQERVCTRFTWANQAARMAEFIQRLNHKPETASPAKSPEGSGNAAG